MGASASCGQPSAGSRGERGRWARLTCPCTTVLVNASTHDQATRGGKPFPTHSRLSDGPLGVHPVIRQPCEPGRLRGLAASSALPANACDRTAGSTACTTRVLILPCESPADPPCASACQAFPALADADKFLCTHMPEHRRDHGASNDDQREDSDLHRLRAQAQDGLPWKLASRSPPHQLQ